MLIESLKVFCDLVDTQSFSKTASLNAVTQSAVSQQLKSIEKRQGRRLVEREKRQLSLTAEGEIFYNCAKWIVRHYEEMQYQIEGLTGVVSGTVRLSTIYSLGMQELGRYLKVYLKSYPNVNLRLSYGLSPEIYDRVTSSEVDLGIVAYPRPQRNVEAVPFTKDLLVLICHPEHPLAERAKVSMQDLDKAPLVTFPEDTTTRQALEQIFRKHRVRPEVVMEMEHIATIKNAVEVGLGVSIVPVHAVVQEGKRKTLRVLPLEDELIFRPLGILYRKSHSLSPAAQKLMEVLTDPSISRTDIRSKEILEAVASEV